LQANNAIIITWAAALDARHASAVARALGATPADVTAGLSAAQVLPTLVGALLGVPGGLGLWSALSNAEAATPTYWQLLTVVVGTVLVVAALTAIPARLGHRRPVADILQSELA
jgi:ABC-type lipoprotein release transport system permease subunit